MSSIPAESPTRVAIALVRRGNRFLVGTRPEGLPLAGCREFPGGKCEPGEAADEAARRECMEETGLDVVTGSLRRVVRHAYPHALVELYYWDCEPADSGGEPDPGSGYVWVEASKLAGLNFPEANAPVLESLGREFPDPA